MEDLCARWKENNDISQDRPCECKTQPYLTHCQGCAALLDGEDPKDPWCSDCWRDEKLRRAEVALEEEKKAHEKTKDRLKLIEKFYGLLAPKHGGGRNGCPMCETVAEVTDFDRTARHT